MSNINRAFFVFLSLQKPSENAGVGAVSFADNWGFHSSHLGLTEIAITNVCAQIFILYFLQLLNIEFLVAFGKQRYLKPCLFISLFQPLFNELLPGNCSQVVVAFNITDSHRKIRNLIAITAYKVVLQVRHLHDLRSSFI